VKSGIYLYTIDVSDYRELIPWVRSFGEHVRVMESNSHDLALLIKQDWEDMVKLYGDI
jgi:hypothetical protein